MLLYCFHYRYCDFYKSIGRYGNHNNLSILCSDILRQADINYARQNKTQYCKQYTGKLRYKTLRICGVGRIALMPV